MTSLALTYKAAGKLDLALPLFVDVVKLSETKLGPDHPRTIDNVGNLLGGYLAAKQFDLARPLIKDFVDRKRKSLAADDPRFGSLLASVGGDLLKHRQCAEAEPLLRECLALREKKLPDSWTTFDAKSLLGEALLGQEKYADAEPLLVQGYEGMRQLEAKIPPGIRRARLKAALGRLVQLYEATGNKDEAARWRQKLGETTKAAAKKAGP
jgi:hypothetical protein